MVKPTTRPDGKMVSSPEAEAGPEPSGDTLRFVEKRNGVRRAWKFAFSGPPAVIQPA